MLKFFLRKIFLQPIISDKIFFRAQIFSRKYFCSAKSAKNENPKNGSYSGIEGDLSVSEFRESPEPEKFYGKNFLGLKIFRKNFLKAGNFFKNIFFLLKNFQENFFSRPKLIEPIWLLYQY